jgi:hypothetical protein
MNPQPRPQEMLQRDPGLPPSASTRSFETGHFPTIFKESKTLVLPKPRKPDYTKLNAYRSIAFECTIGMALESIMAETISYLTEKHKLLPANHFGHWWPCVQVNRRRDDDSKRKHP